MAFPRPGWQRLSIVGLVLLLLVLGGSVAARVLIHVPLFQTEREWFEAQAAYLSKVQFTPQMKAAAMPWRRQGDYWEYFLRGREGFIPIGADNGVYVVCHSAHDDEPRGVKREILRLQFRAGVEKGRPRVTDAILAVDQQGNLYKCGGHICGALYFVSKKEVLTLSDFLETQHEDRTWEPYVGAP